MIPHPIRTKPQLPSPKPTLAGGWAKASPSPMERLPIKDLETAISPWWMRIMRTMFFIWLKSWRVTQKINFYKDVLSWKGLHKRPMWFWFFMLKLEYYKYLKGITNNPIITIQKLKKRLYNFILNSLFLVRKNQFEHDFFFDYFIICILITKK